ncbi:hypothetical protein TNCT_77641 [Trichonephila clavata]|uniref:Uncharacterized protein n=1 Tax=Trichonephila clavata TaxID=2740835 RepID=A0A8X6J9M2_TRICU|nr:hypothetical protein TNCT_77641 [Trichonephila clavata]
MKSEQREEWEKAMSSEIETMHNRGVWHLEKLPEGKKLNYDDTSIVEHMTLSSSMEFQKFLIIQKISTPCQWIATMRRLIAVTPDNSNRNAGESGSSRTWNTHNQAYSNINTGTDPLIPIKRI